MSIKNKEQGLQGTNRKEILGKAHMEQGRKMCQILMFKLSHASKQEKGKEARGGGVKYLQPGNYRDKENEPGIRTIDEKRQDGN